MKKKKMYSLLSSLLAVVLAFGQPMSVFAEEVATVVVEEEANETIEEVIEVIEGSTEEDGIGEEVSSEETVEETDEDISTEQTTEIAKEEVSTEETTEEIAEIESEEEISTILEEIVEESVTEEIMGESIEQTMESATEELEFADIEINAQMKLLGFRSMPLDEAMLEEKFTHTEVVASISSM